jgi:hypothetical protein
MLDHTTVLNKNIKPFKCYVTVGRCIITWSSKNFIFLFYGIQRGLQRNNTNQLQPFPFNTCNKIIMWDFYNPCVYFSNMKFSGNISTEFQYSFLRLWNLDYQSDSYTGCMLQDGLLKITSPINSYSCFQFWPRWIFKKGPLSRAIHSHRTLEKSCTKYSSISTTHLTRLTDAPETWKNTSNTQSCLIYYS